MKIVILSPHRDDAAFSLSLSIALWLESGHSVEVVNCFTRSAYAPLNAANDIAPEADWRRVADLRAREDMAWCDRFEGNLVLTDVSLWDAPIRLSCSEDEVCGLLPNPEDSSIERIAKAVREARGDAHIFPLGLGNHVDHLTTMNVFWALRDQTQIVAFYEDLPYAARPGVAETIEDTALHIDRGLVGAFVADVTDKLIATESKLRYASCYPSQVDQRVVEQIAEFSQRYEGRERLWVDGGRVGAGALFHDLEAKRMPA